MTFRPFLTASLAAAMLLTACASDDAPDTTDLVTEQPADASTTEPDPAADEPPTDAGEDPADDTTGDDGVDDTAGDAAVDDAADDDTTDDTDHGGADAAAGGTHPAAVVLTFDGQRVPIASACNGVDGAVLATTEGEVTITLVREAGTVLRYQGEGMTAETDAVDIEQVGDSTLYRATLESEQVPAVDVELELGDTSVLEDC